MSAAPRTAADAADSSPALKGELLAGAGCGALRVVERFVDVSARSSFGEVIGELREMRCGICSVKRFQHLRDPAV